MAPLKPNFDKKKVSEPIQNNNSTDNFDDVDFDDFDDSFYNDSTSNIDNKNNTEIENEPINTNNIEIAIDNDIDSFNSNNNFAVDISNTDVGIKETHKKKGLFAKREKQPKIKKEKKPKINKETHTDDTNTDKSIVDHGGKTMRKTKKQLEEDEKKRLEKLKKKESRHISKKLIALICGVVVILITLVILIVVSKNNKEKASKHIVIADNSNISTGLSTEEKNMQLTKEAVEGNSNIESTQESSELAVVDRTSTPTESSESLIKDTETVAVETTKVDTDKVVMKSGENIDIPVTVNVKLDGDEAFTDHDDRVQLKLSSTITGYDNVIKYIDEYNEGKTTIVSLPNKEDFYANSEGNELTMFEFEIAVPNDFIKQAEDSKDTYLKPSANLAIEGIEQEDKLITDRVVYKVPNVTDITTDNLENLQIGEKYKIKFITTLPSEANSDIYKMVLNLNISDKDNKITFEGQQIPKLDNIIISSNTVDSDESQE